MSDYVLTAADYTYLDRVDTLYTETKQFIQAHRNNPASDSHTKRRPGIPGTIGVLNERVMTLVDLGQYETAARLIAKKVSKAYGLTP